MYSDHRYDAATSKGMCVWNVQKLSYRGLLSMAVRMCRYSVDQQHHDGSNPARPANQSWGTRQSGRSRKKCRIPGRTLAETEPERAPGRSGLRSTGWLSPPGKFRFALGSGIELAEPE